MARRLRWPSLLESRRFWLIALGIAVVLRIALPYALRPILESQASQAINAWVDIGDVDLALHRAGIALEDVAVRPAGWTPEGDTGDPPLIAWKRLAVAVRWLPLLWKTIQLRELTLESPRVAIDRLQDGGLNLMALAPAVPVETAEPAGEGDEAQPASKQEGSWGFGVDRVVLRDGGVRFRDLMFRGVEPVDLSLGSFEVEEIAFDPSVYGEPAQIHLEARVDEGRFVLDASLSPREDGGFVLGSHLKARRLPLRRTRVYVPNVGWSELEGEFGGALDYTLETAGRNQVSGQVTVDGLKVHTPQLEGPGLAWKRLAVLVDPIDLAGHRAVVRWVDLDGSYLVARARGGVVFPFIEQVLTGEPAEPAAAAGGQAAGGAEGDAPPAARAGEAAAPPSASPLPPPPPSSTPPVAPTVPAPTPAAAAPTPGAGDESPAWQWQVDRVRVWNSLLHVISPDASFDTGCTLTVRDLRSEGSDPAAIALTLGIGDAGTITVDGKTRIQPLGFEGRVKASQVPLPDIVATVGAFPPGVVQRARLDADLGVAAGVLAPAAGDVRVEGTIAFDEPYLVGAGGPTTEFGAKRLAFGMQELHIPGGLPEEPPVVAADARLSGGTVSLQEMWAVRTEPAPFDVRAASLDATLEELTAPGIGPPPADGGALRLRGTMKVADLLAGNAGGSGLDVGVRTVDVGVGEFVLPGIVALDPATVTAPMRLAKGWVTLSEPSAVGTGPQKLDTRAQNAALTVGELLVPGALGGVPGEMQLRDARLDVAGPRVLDNRVGRLDVSARGIDVALGTLLVPPAVDGPAKPLRLRAARLTVADPRVVDARADRLQVRARGIDVGIEDLLAPADGAVAGVELRGGRLALAEPAVADADAKVFAVGARSIGVGVDEIALPGTAPTRVRLREVTLATPRVQITRTADGLSLPGFGGDGAAAPPPGPGTAVTTTPTSAGAAAETPPSTVAMVAPASPPAVASAPAVPPGLDLAVARFRLTDGRVGVTDRSVKPFYVGGLAPLSIEVANLRWPAMEASRLRVDATSAQTGKITVTGSLGPNGGKVEVDGSEIPLKQFNPYAVSLSPYSIRRGSLSLDTKATFGQGKYDSDSELVLHDFDLGSRKGESLFKEQFGIPLSMALALLRDLQGDIKLDIPVEGDEQGMRIGYMAIIASALKQALLGAIASPLKLVGAIFSGDKVQAAPAPITFRTGQVVLTGDGDKQVGQLGKFLAERPAMGVALETAPTKADARWLHEHDLLEELGAPQGVFGSVRNLTRRGVRDRITQALAARAEDKPGELDAEDQQTLEEWLAERPAPTPERVRDLAESRLARVEEALRQKHGIDGSRLVRRDLPAEPADAEPPTVEIELGSVADLTAPPEEEQEPTS